jgi:hypothetical protein
VAKVNTTIQINDKIYDVKTGKVLANNLSPEVADKKPNPISKTSSVSSASGIVMDGVIRKPSVNNHIKKEYSVANHPKVALQKSQTLHRKAVQKPAPKTHVHSTSANVHSKVERSATGRGMLLKRVPDNRLRRAMTAPKSNLIQKFNSTKPTKAMVTTNLSVAQAPKDNNNTNVSATPPIHHLPKKSFLPKSNKKYVFEDSIKNANSHLLKPVKKEKRSRKFLKSLKVSPKVLSISAAVFAFIALGGFFAYQNVPQISMRVAANQAGFMGKMPKSLPSGYSFAGPVAATEGSLALTYQSNSDDRRFVMVQRPSNWSSESLLTNYLLDSKFRYQAYKDRGLTVYIYNGTNATWVDKGIWYNVNSDDDSLSASQLLEIAASI